MANTIVGFTIQIDGINTIDQLNAEIKATTQAMKGLDTATEEYSEQANKLGKLKAEQKAIKKQQDDLNKSFLETSKSLGSYDKLSAKLNRLRKEYKNLAVEGKDTTAEGKKMRAEIDKLDGQLKKVDETTGQFQRSVGNYPRVFGMSAKSVGQFIPGLDKLSARVDKLTGGTNVLGKAFIAGFVAFKAGGAIIKAIGALDDLVKSVDETRNSIAGLTDASGDDLDKLTSGVTALSTTFGVDAKEISKAAAELATKTGVSFETALKQIENGLLSGQASNEEFLSSISEYPELLNEVGVASGEYADRQRDLLSVNKELAAAQVETASKLAGLSTQLQVFGTKAKSFLLETLISAINFFKPVIAAAVDFGKAIGGLVSALFGFSDGAESSAQAAKAFNNIILLIQNTLIGAIKYYTLIADSISSLVGLLKGDMAKAWQTFTKEGAQAARVQEQVRKATVDLTKEYKNEVDGLNQLFGELAKTNEGSQERKDLIEQLNEQYGEYLPNIDLEVAGQEDLQRAYEETTKAIARSLIERKKAQLQEEAASQILEAKTKQILAQDKAARIAQELSDANITIGSDLTTASGAVVAFGKDLLGFEKNSISLIKALRKANAEAAAQDRILEDAQKTIKALGQATDGLAESLSGLYSVEDLKKNVSSSTKVIDKSVEKQKKDADELKKRYEELQKERAKFQENEAKFSEQQSALLLNLQKRTNALILDAIKDEQTKARTIEKKGLEDRLAQAQSQYDSLIELQAEREAEALRLYGANSQELAMLRENNAIQAAKADEERSDIEIKERLKTQEALREIDAKFEKATIDDRKAAFQARANDLRSETDRLKTIAERQKVEGVISEEEYQQELYNIEKDRIDKELMLLKQRQSFEDMLKKAGIETSESESTAILNDKEKLYLDLAKLDADYTAKNKANETARLAAAKDANKERLEDFQAKFELAAQIGLQLLEIFDGFLEVTNERRMKRIEESEEQNAKQLEDLNERLQTATGLERRFLEQQVTDNAVAADQIAKDKEKAEKERAKQEKARAIIEAVIATALAVIKSLPNIPLSILAGITGAASVATIAAQPLAKGGVVGEGDEIVQFANGGKVTSKGNIKPLSNGDNVLATLKTGEVVLNQKQQRKIGYKSLKSAGIPNFANGGLVGAPTSIIQTANEDTALAKRNLELLQSGIEATNARFDRLQVNWTANTEENADKGRTDRKEIKANAQF